MEVVEKLSYEFQIQLVVKVTDPLSDMLRLHVEIFVIIKSCFHTLIIPS